MSADLSAGWVRRLKKTRVRTAESHPLPPASPGDPLRSWYPGLIHPDPVEARENYRALLVYLLFGASVFGATYLISYEDFQRQAARPAQSHALRQAGSPAGRHSVHYARIAAGFSRSYVAKTHTFSRLVARGNRLSRTDFRHRPWPDSLTGNLTLPGAAQRRTLTTPL